MINIQVNFIYKDQYKIDEKNISKNISSFLEKKIKNQKITELEVNIYLVSKKDIRTLNKKFRKIDKPTDVLSFPIFKNLSEINLTKEKFISIGDIFVCPEIASNQTPKNSTLEKEFLKLIMHGLKHLVGIHHK